jgi:hypothetical protein
VVFNYKRCSLIDMESPSQEGDEEEEEIEVTHSGEENDEEEENSNESAIDFTHSLEELESMSIPEHVVLGEEVVNSDWADLEDLTDSRGQAGPQRVSLKLFNDDWIFFSFYSKCPEILMQCTDPDLSWQIYHEDQHIASVPPNGQLTLRGYFFLNLEDLVIRANGRFFPLKHDPQFQEFLKPNTNYAESPEAAVARHERIQMFMEYLRNHLVA